MRVRRITGAVAAIVGSALVLTACGSGGGSDDKTSTPAAPTTSTGIVTNWGGEPQNALIPTNTNEVQGGKVLDLVFAGLMYYDKDGKPHNEMAKSVESTDSKTWTVTIKPDQEFSDGTPVLAKNFVDAWNYGALLSNAQLSSYFFESIEGYSAEKDSELTGLKVVDDHTFTVTLKQPEADFPLRLGYSAYFPLPDSAFADMDAFGKSPIGNGPYVLESWDHNRKIELRPSAKYTGDRKARNGGIDIVLYDSLDAAYADLTSGQLDILDQVPDTQYATYTSDLPDTTVNQPGAVFQSFTIPQKLAHFEGEEGKLRREAISLAINRDEITDKIFQATRTPAKDFTSPVIAGWSDKIDGHDVLSYDPDKAKELWAKADEMSPWSGTFTIGYNSDGGHQAWVDAVSNSVKNVLGIDAQGKPYPAFKDLRDDVTNRTIKGAFRSGWQADYPSSYNFLGPLYGTGAGSNDGDYTNPEVDQLLKDGLAAKSVDEANAAFTKVQEILFVDLPAIPLWYQNSVGAWGPEVKHVTFGWNSVPLLYEVTKN